MPTVQDFDIASTVVRYNRNNRMLFAYQSRPRDYGFYPGVLVLHDVEGLTDYERAFTRRLAAEDFCAKAFDIYSRAEEPKPKKLQTAEDRSKWFAKIPDTRVLEDLERTWEVFRKLHWTHGKKCGVIGFGMGAYYAMLMAGLVDNCDACIAVSPRFTTEQSGDLKPSKLQSSMHNASSDVLVFCPGADPEVPEAATNHVLDCLDRQSVSAIPVRYPQAGARFWLEGEETHTTRTAQDMWAGILAYLDARLR